MEEKCRENRKLIDKAQQSRSIFQQRKKDTREDRQKAAVVPSFVLSGVDTRVVSPYQVYVKLEKERMRALYFWFKAEPTSIKCSLCKLDGLC